MEVKNTRYILQFMMQIINKFYLAITSIVVAAPLLTAAVQKPYIADYLLGVEGQDAKVKSCRLAK